MSLRTQSSLDVNEDDLQQISSESTKLVFEYLTTISGRQVRAENHAGEKAKYTTKEVMAEAHKGGLMKKVADLKASDEEKTKLVELYVALSQNDPRQPARQ